MPSPSTCWASRSYWVGFPPSTAGCSLDLGPRHLGWQRHQDRLRVPARLETEQRAAVIEQVELDIAAAADQLVTALRLAPALVHMAADDGRIDIEKGDADIAGKGEIPFPIATFQIVEKDSADPARLIAVLQ